MNTIDDYMNGKIQIVDSRTGEIFASAYMPTHAPLPSLEATATPTPGEKFTPTPTKEHKKHREIPVKTPTPSPTYTPSPSRTPISITSSTGPHFRIPNTGTGPDGYSSIPDVNLPLVIGTAGVILVGCGLAYASLMSKIGHK